MLFKRNAVSSQEAGTRLVMKGKANLSFCNNAGSLSRTDCCISWTILLGRRRDGGRMNKVAFISHLSVIQPQRHELCLCFWVLCVGAKWASSVPQTSASRRGRLRVQSDRHMGQHAGLCFWSQLEPTQNRHQKQQLEQVTD